VSYLNPGFRHPELSVNELGSTKADSDGALSHLCPCCGYDPRSVAIAKVLH